MGYATGQLILLWAITASDSPAGDRQGDADTRSLNELQKRVDAAIVRGDTDTYATLLTTDAVLMPPNGPTVVGRTAILEWSRKNAKTFSFEDYQSTDAELVIVGDWAFRRAAFRMTLLPTGGGPKVRDSGKFIIIYQRQKDGWKVARDIWNSDGAAEQ
jgi:ketosteroid isomerase-like protein